MIIGDESCALMGGRSSDDHERYPVAPNPRSLVRQRLVFREAFRIHITINMNL